MENRTNENSGLLYCPHTADESSYNICSTLMKIRIYQLDQLKLSSLSAWCLLKPRSRGEYYAEKDKQTVNSIWRSRKWWLCAIWSSNAESHIVSRRTVYRWHHFFLLRVCEQHTNSKAQQWSIIRTQRSPRTRWRVYVVFDGRLWDKRFYFSFTFELVRLSYTLTFVLFGCKSTAILENFEEKSRWKIGFAQSVITYVCTNGFCRYFK